MVSKDLLNWYANNVIVIVNSYIDKVLERCNNTSSHESSLEPQFMLSSQGEQLN